jgi:hypothetical protein
VGDNAIKDFSIEGIRVFAPKGPQHTSPGQRPGKEFRTMISPEGAQQPYTFVPPFQGLLCLHFFPGRCPDALNIFVLRNSVHRNTFHESPHSWEGIR